MIMTEANPPKPLILQSNPVFVGSSTWVAVKELKLSYHNPKTMVFTIYPCYGNLNYVPQQQPCNWSGKEPRRRLLAAGQPASSGRLRAGAASPRLPEASNCHLMTEWPSKEFMVHRTYWDYHRIWWNFPNFIGSAKVRGFGLLGLFSKAQNEALWDLRGSGSNWERRRTDAARSGLSCRIERRLAK